MLKEKEESDDELIELIKQDSVSAKHKLLNRYKTLVRNLVRQFTDNAEEQQDLVHDIFVVVLDKIKSFEHRSSFKTWLYRVSLNKLLDYKKRNSRISYISLEDNISVHASASIYSTERIKHYYAGLLLCLDSEQYTSIAAADIFKMEHNEASRLLNTTPENFRKKLSRSRKDLRNWMENKCSLVKPGSECQCIKKAKHFVDEGWVDAATLTFKRERIKDVFQYIETIRNISDSPLMSSEKDQ